MLRPGTAGESSLGAAGCRSDDPAAFTTARDEIGAFGFIPKAVTPCCIFASGAGSSAILANWKGTLPGEVSWSAAIKTHTPPKLLLDFLRMGCCCSALRSVVGNAPVVRTPSTMHWSSS